ncbi:putative signal transducing protein [Chryseosolibacter indicus]|uniref:DUF2007 domain-containing protein n=1 Tax=Chryseosolibacter indicus TaxID=2782351 RepID=A0ABS5VP76_9BACT|nr:DUF2007 domain-containing protein [Chryseosolibacter indicus]MBT1703218.1 DUF2007 domain-containing protein [Chryseosolibacter indicus]
MIKMKERDDIVVYKVYDTAIDANIAKTKLDAYGIPCFLTEENLSNLYPAQPFLGFKVRLHLFSGDKEKAREILDEVSLSVSYHNSLQCPSCGSTRITRTFPKGERESFKVLFFGVLFPHRKVNLCRECDNEF